MYLVGPFLLNVISSLSLCSTVNLPRLSHNITYVYSSWHASMQINFTAADPSFHFPQLLSVYNFCYILRSLVDSRKWRRSGRQSRIRSDKLN